MLKHVGIRDEIDGKSESKEEKAKRKKIEDEKKYDRIRKEEYKNIKIKREREKRADKPEYTPEAFRKMS